MTVQDGSIGKTEKAQQIRNERGKLQLISQKCKGPQKTTMNIYNNKLDNLEETETFLQTNIFPRGNHEETENMNTPVEVT